MPSPVRSLRGWLAHKIETTPGTAETITAAEIKTRVINPEVNTDIQQTEREILSQSLSPWATVTGARKATLSFESDLAGATGATLQASGCEQHDFLRACGLKATGTASPDDGHLYEPTSDDSLWKTLTLKLWQDSGNAHTFFGAMGSVMFPFRLGMPCRAKFTFACCYLGAPAFVALPTSGTGIITDALKPPVLLASACTLHSDSGLVFRELDVVVNNNPTLLENFGAPACGYERAYLGERPTTGRVKFNLPRFTGSGDFNVEERLRDVTVGGLSLTLGSAENNRFVLTVPSNSLQFVGQVRMTKENGIVVVDAPFKLNRNNTVAGDDEFSLLAD